MNKYKQRKGNLYQKGLEKPFSISRSKIDLFLECPRCFYLDRKLGLGKPGMPGFSLNSAVDALLKNEFDLLRKNGQKHELMIKYGIDAIPLSHPDLPIWRDDVYRYKGISTIHKATNLEICGIIDDVWINKQEELIIVDYKATSTSTEISLEDEYKQGYKKQLEVYQWIFRQKGFKVNETGYFVYANAGKNRNKFDARLEFELQIISHKGDTSWVEPTIFEIKKCLDSDVIPESNPDCEHCMYRKLMNTYEKNH
ncbi:PD-(D/E)XK nuclease family protein [Patescibacteria group bacterium]|nr:PD-(D/E)XK nuclease family protein [Patescibacteria group bacterium]